MSALYTLNQLESMARNQGDITLRHRSPFLPAPSTFTITVPRKSDNRGTTIEFRLLHSGLYEFRGDK